MIQRTEGKYERWFRSIQITLTEMAASAKFQIGGKTSRPANDSMGNQDGQVTMKWNMSTTFH